MLDLMDILGKEVTMALAIHTINSTLDAPDQGSPRVRIKNRLSGTIIARHLQFPHYPSVKYRVRMSDGGAIDFVSAPLTEECNGLDIGQQVTLDVVPKDVLLSPPRWVHPSENNRWPGRVVLTAGREFESLLVVKILGRFWTLTSTRRTFWLNRAPCAWDRVTVHIPLDAISITRRYPGHPHLRPRLLRQVTSQNDRNLQHAHNETGESGTVAPVQIIAQDLK
jgi:hypothetical protein